MPNRLTYMNCIQSVQEYLNEITFYDEIPKSRIAFEDDGDDSIEKIKSKSNELYYKYVDYGAEYEIIIGNHARHHVTEVMSHLDWIDDKNIDANVVMELWDLVIDDLWILLLDCYSRFEIDL